MQSRQHFCTALHLAIAPKAERSFVTRFSLPILLPSPCERAPAKWLPANGLLS